MWCSLGQHTAFAVRAGTHRRLGPFTRLEVLHVHPVKQLHRLRHVRPRRHHLRLVQPVAVDFRAALGKREPPVQDDVIRYEIDEDRCVAVGELWEDIGEFGMERRAVAALHETLDDQLPVRLHVIGDAFSEREVLRAVALDGGRVTDPLDGRTRHRLLKGGGFVGEAHPRRSGATRAAPP